MSNKGAKKISEKYAIDSKFMPIGLNGTTAVGLVRKEGYNDFRRAAIAVTASQYALSWKHTLLLATTEEQYENANAMYSALSLYQPFLKACSENVFRDEEVFQHKKALPCGRVAKMAPEQPCMWSQGVVIYETKEPTEGSIRVVFNQYKTHQMWKESKITLPDNFPYCYLNDKGLLSCVLLENNKIQVEYYPDILNGKRKHCFLIDDECTESPIGTTDGKWVAIVNGHRGVVVFSMEDITKCFKFTVEGDCVTALKIHGDQLCIGTFVGRYYRMNIPTGECYVQEILVEPIAIVAIEFLGVRVLVQTISHVQYMEEPSVAMFDRPLSSTLFDGNVVLFNEFGTTRIIKKDGSELEMKPPKVVQCDPFNITPWYQHAIYCKKDEGISVLMPNGMVVSYDW